MPKFSQRSKDALTGVHPDVVKVFNAAIVDSPIDFTVTQGVRTAAQQAAEYSKGRRGIKGEKTVTSRDGFIKKSEHQVKADGYGYAVDAYPFVNGKVQADEKTYPQLRQDLKVIAAHVLAHAKRLNVKMVWGGSWKAKDLPHFEKA